MRVEHLVSVLNGAGVATDGSHPEMSFDLGDSFPWVLIACGEENLAQAKILVSAYNRSRPKFRWEVKDFHYYRDIRREEKEERWRVVPEQRHLGGAGIEALTQFILTFVDPEPDPAS